MKSAGRDAGESSAHPPSDPPRAAGTEALPWAEIRPGPAGLSDAGQALDLPGENPAPQAAVQDWPAPHLPPDPSSVADLLDLLVRDLLRSLYSEFGAYSVYVLLRRWTRHRDLLPLLRQMASEEQQLIAAVRQLIERLGGKAPKRRWTRSVAAWGLWLATPVMGMPFALRLCREAERSVSRWYAQHTVLLYQLGRLEEAQATRAWSQTKHVHAVRLGAFIDHLRRGD
jgi:Ubiquinone biosynthesis protein COQ7